MTTITPELTTYLRSLRRYELRDLTFGDTEIILENANGVELGGGYFGGGDRNMWVTNPDGTTVSFQGELADQVRKIVPVERVERNDNQGEW